MECLAGNNNAAAFGLSNSVMSTAANTTAPYQKLPLQQGKTTPNQDWLLPHQVPRQCKFLNSGLPMALPDEFEFPSRHLGTDEHLTPEEFPSRHLGADEHLTPAAQGGTTVVQQDHDESMQQLPASLVPEQGSSQDMEARAKLKEKREQAMQRYKDKRKTRRFGKQIKYVCRKVCADRRFRVKGRFAQASSSRGGHGDIYQSTQHGHGDDDHPTHS